MTIMKVYDGSFEGLLTTIFMVFEEQLSTVRIQSLKNTAPNFFDNIEEVPTNSKIAERVWKGLSKHCSKIGKSHVYRAFLSETSGVENSSRKMI